MPVDSLRIRGRIASGLVLALGLVMLLLTHDAVLGGQKKNNPASAAKKTADMQLVDELHATRALLEKANHDYKGHRVAAVHHLMHAAHLLQHHKPHPNPEAHTAHLGKPHFRGNEPQPLSDQQLQQAAQQLHVISKQIQNLGNGDHHQKAHKAVRHAIQELHTALKIA